jgi:hypothetical protein
VVIRALNLSAIQVSLLFTRAGWLASLGGLCLLTSALFHFLLSPQFQDRKDASLRQIAIRQSEDARPPDTNDLVPRYTEFRGRLLASKAWSEHLKSVFAVATQAGVTPEQADYRWRQDAACGCQALQLTMPVRGTYPQLRAFIDALLAEFPSLALDEISLQRESVRHPNVDARLQLTLYLRTED